MRVVNIIIKCDDCESVVPEKEVVHRTIQFAGQSRDYDLCPKCDGHFAMYMDRWMLLGVPTPNAPHRPKRVPKDTVVVSSRVNGKKATRNVGKSITCDVDGCTFVASSVVGLGVHRSRIHNIVGASHRPKSKAKK